MSPLAPTSAEGEWFVRWTIRLALVLYAAALAGILTGARPLQRPSWLRLAWTGAWLVYVVHVLAAFHVYHHWSHDNAYDHTQAVSGFGPGIFVSYAFTLLWGLDATWWWLASASYACRPRRLSLSVHAALAFIIFNGAVLFAAGAVRWTSLAATLLLLALPAGGYYYRKSREPGAVPESQPC
jgi:hypothetical protein